MFIVFISHLPAKHANPQNKCKYAGKATKRGRTHCIDLKYLQPRGSNAPKRTAISTIQDVLLAAMWFVETMCFACG